LDQRLPFLCPEGQQVLKISMVDSRTQRRLVIEGALISPWLAELKRAWIEAGESLQDRKLLIDLRDITVISSDGETFLRALIDKGTGFSFSRSGALTKHLLQQLVRKRRDQS
jgi:hypothetical protein